MLEMERRRPSIMLWQHSMMRKLQSQRRGMMRVRMKRASELEVGIFLIGHIVDIVSLGREVC